jgi:hypothetical protein
MTDARKILAASEHEEQAALFAWAELQARQWPELALMFAIANGGHRHISVAKRLKAEGVKAGVPDICLPIPRTSHEFEKRFSGLFIEMKVKPNKPTEAQRDWLEDLERQGYRCEVCYSAAEARRVITEYLGRAERRVG